MPKKTSRSARALQAQRTSLNGERRTAARPLIDINNSRLVAEAAADTEVEGNLGDMDAVFEPKTAPVPVMPALNARAVSATAAAARPLSQSRPTAPAASSGSNVIRPASGASRRPIARRTATAVNRGPAISREEEYSYIRTDLLTVFVLTVLMVIALIVLTFVIGR